MDPRRGFSFAAALVAVCGALGLCDSVFNYFYRPGGISHSPGVLLVIVSCALIAGDGLGLAIFSRSSWLRTVFVALLLLGLLGTGVAAYFLEADLLLGLMILGLIGWCAERIGPRPPERAMSIHTSEAAR